MSSTVSGTATSAAPAGLDRRFYAEVVDRLLAWVVYGAAGWAGIALHLGWAGVGLVAALVVVVWLVGVLLTGIVGATPGKAMLGLKVVDQATGGSIGLGRAALRQLMLGIAGLPTIGIGLGTLAWTALMDSSGQRRGWHDVVTHARVDDVRPAVVPVPVTTEEPKPIVNLTAMRLAPAPETPAPPAAPAPPLPTPAVPPAPAPAATAVPAAPVAVPVPPMPSSGGWAVAFDTGEQFVVTGLVLVGRNPEGRADEPPATLLSLPSTDMSLSKTHAQFQVVPDGALVVMDRGSTNGSTLVREGVSRPLAARKPATLREGDVVHFGDRAMRVSRV